MRPRLLHQLTLTPPEHSVASKLFSYLNILIGHFEVIKFALVKDILIKAQIKKKISFQESCANEKISIIQVAHKQYCRRFAMYDVCIRFRILLLDQNNFSDLAFLYDSE